MAEKVTAGPITSANGVREAVCIHTKKIFSSCKDKDCIEDLTFYPTATAQSVIDASQSIRGGRVELLHVGVDVEPVSFNRGFFTVDMRFYYRVILQAVNNGMRATEIEGLATFDKRVMLFGGESRAKVFSSYPVPGGADYPIDLTANLPTAVVTAVDPLLLCARIVDCSCGNCCDCAAVTGVPTGIAEAFDEPILFEPQTRRVCISIGQFSIVRLERGTQLLIPVFDYCNPERQLPAGRQHFVQLLRRSLRDVRECLLPGGRFLPRRHRGGRRGHADELLQLRRQIKATSAKRRELPPLFSSSAFFQANRHDLSTPRIEWVI